jgi:ankyrin repeat/SOCS box protein 13/metal transporter CNNM
MRVGLGARALALAALALALPARGNNHKSPDPGSDVFWIYVSLCLVLVAVGGLMSGLTVGLFSLDPLKLKLLQANRAATERDKQRAARLLPIINQHHVLLVTLLVTNSAAMESLPIFLDRLVPTGVAIVISVTAVLIFGEIIPQAIFTRDPLRIGAVFAPALNVLMKLLLPLTWPLGKLLDLVLGADGGSHYLYNRSELKALIEVHAEDGGALTAEELAIMKGALKLRQMTVEQCLTPLRDVFMLPDDQPLNEETLTALTASGHSRVPTFRGSRNSVTGLLLVKKLILLGPNTSRRVRDLAVHRPLVCHPSTPVFDILRQFQRGKGHLAVVASHPDTLRECMRAGAAAPPHVQVLGVITLEDVVQQLIHLDSAPSPRTSPRHAAAAAASSSSASSSSSSASAAAAASSPTSSSSSAAAPSLLPPSAVRVIGDARGDGEDEEPALPDEAAHQGDDDEDDLGGAALEEKGLLDTPARAHARRASQAAASPQQPLSAQGLPMPRAGASPNMARFFAVQRAAKRFRELGAARRARLADAVAQRAGERRAPAEQVVVEAARAAPSYGAVAIDP